MEVQTSVTQLSEKTPDDFNAGEFTQNVSSWSNYLLACNKVHMIHIKSKKEAVIRKA